MSSSWLRVCVYSVSKLESLVDSNDGSIFRTGVHHIFEAVDEERHPCKAESTKEDQDTNNYPHHHATLVVDVSRHLWVKQEIYVQLPVSFSLV